MYPTDYRYSKDHEWIAVEDGTGTVGITEFAQHELGDIVFVSFPEKGARVAAGDVLATIDSVKTSSEVFAPMTGTVLETNGLLADAPEKVNQDPHGEGWLCKLRLQDPSEIARLMDARAYEAHIAE